MKKLKNFFKGMNLKKINQMFILLLFIWGSVFCILVSSKLNDAHWKIILIIFCSLLGLGLGAYLVCFFVFKKRDKIQHEKEIKKIMTHSAMNDLDVEQASTVEGQLQDYDQKQKQEDWKAPTNDGPLQMSNDSISSLLESLQPDKKKKN